MINIKAFWNMDMEKKETMSCTDKVTIIVTNKDILTAECWGGEDNKRQVIEANIHYIPY